MSETSTQNPNRRRSRGGRNRNRGGQQGDREDRGGRDGRDGQQGGNRGGQRNRSRSRRRAPKPPPLTWWQKILKAVGLYDPSKKSPAQGTGKRGAPKSNTRVATGAKPRPADRRDEPRDEPRDERRDERRDEPRDEPRSRDEASAPPPTEVETPRLYVGNLSYDATEQDLEELFKGFGSVREIEIVYNRRTHRSKGYAFLVMHHLDDAKRAVEVLHDQPFMGRKMIVNGAKSDGPADQDDSDNRDERDDRDERDN